MLDTDLSPRIDLARRNREICCEQKNRNWENVFCGSLFAVPNFVNGRVTDADLDYFDGRLGSTLREAQTHSRFEGWTVAGTRSVVRRFPSRVLSKLQSVQHPLIGRTELIE